MHIEKSLVLISASLLLIISLFGWSVLRPEAELSGVLYLKRSVYSCPALGFIQFGSLYQEWGGKEDCNCSAPNSNIFDSALFLRLTAPLVKTFAIRLSFSWGQVTLVGLLLFELSIWSFPSGGTRTNHHPGETSYTMCTISASRISKVCTTHRRCDTSSIHAEDANDCSLGWYYSIYIPKVPWPALL